MKITIRRPDGTVIEAEGTVEECERLIGSAPAPEKKTDLGGLLDYLREVQRNPPTPLPFVPSIPVPYHPPILPWEPAPVPTDPWTNPYPNYRFTDIPLIGRPIVTCDRVSIDSDTRFSGNGTTITIRDENVPVVSSFVQLSSIPSDYVSFT